MTKTLILLCFIISDSVLAHYLLIDDLIDTLIQIWEDEPHDTIHQHIRTSTLGTAYKDDYDAHMHTCTMYVKIFKLCMLCISLICNLNLSKIHNCRHKVLKSAQTEILKMKRYARYLRYCGNQLIQNAVRLSLQLSAAGFQNQIFFKLKP